MKNLQSTETKNLVLQTSNNISPKIWTQSAQFVYVEILWNQSWQSASIDVKLLLLFYIDSATNLHKTQISNLLPQTF